MEKSLSDIIDSDIIMKLKQYVEEYKFEIFIGFIILLVIVMNLKDKGIIDLDFLKNSFEKLKPLSKNILQRSLMVHLEDDELSQKRMKDVSKIYKQYDLPLNTFKALHWKKDKEELEKLPIDYKKVTANNTRPGAYGLAGSFFKCLSKAVQENWSYLLFLEDDSIPILSKEKFNSEFNKVIDTLPDRGEGIFILGTAVYCKTNRYDKKEWLRRNQIKQYISGTHSVLISSKYIHILFDYIQKNGINLAIDNFINEMNPWIWWGDLSENGMFRGLYKQLDMDCFNVRSLPGPINTQQIN